MVGGPKDNFSPKMVTYPFFLQIVTSCWYICAFRKRTPYVSGGGGGAKEGTELAYSFVTFCYGWPPLSLHPNAYWASGQVHYLLAAAHDC